MIPSLVRQAFLVPRGIRDVEPLPAGMSGAQVYRARDEMASYVLRCWPARTRPQRVTEIHRVVSALGEQCRWIPRLEPLVGGGGQTFIADARGRLWDLSEWLPGEPLPFEAEWEQIRQGARAIGQVHQALRRQGVHTAPAPAIAQRLGRAEFLSAQLPRSYRVALTEHLPLELIEPVGLARDWLKSRWSAERRRLQRRLGRWRERPLCLQYVLRDVHREHVLFEGGAVAGIIDFDALRRDTVALDLARWASSFARFRDDPAGTMEETLAGYLADHPLPERTGPGLAADPPIDEFRTLLVELACCSIAISLANWVVWLVLESRTFPDPQRVGVRVNRLLEMAAAVADD